MRLPSSCRACGAPTAPGRGPVAAFAVCDSAACREVKRARRTDRAYWLDGVRVWTDPVVAARWPDRAPGMADDMRRRAEEAWSKPVTPDELAAAAAVKEPPPRQITRPHRKKKKEATHR